MHWHDGDSWAAGNRPKDVIVGATIVYLLMFVLVFENHADMDIDSIV